MPTRLLLLIIFVTGCAARPRPGTAPWRGDDPRAQLAARRAAAIADLHAYRVAEAYPAQPDGLPLSVFRDEQGRRCAMAELIFRSGGAELVDAVATLDNSLRLANVTDGPLMTWMLTSGLTRDEIIAIQGPDMYRVTIEPRTIMPAVGVYGSIADARADLTARLAALETSLTATTEASLDVAVASLPAPLLAQRSSSSSTSNSSVALGGITPPAPRAP